MKDRRPPFNPDTGHYVARKPFRFAGRSYATGDSFPFRRLSIGSRALFRLHDNGFLSASVEPGAEEKDPARVEAGKKAAETRKKNAAAKSDD